MPDGHARLPEPRRGRAATSRTTPSASASSDRIRLGAGVDARPRACEGGGWELELADGERERFDALVVANGHNEVADVARPAVPGRRSPASSCTRSTTASARGLPRASGVLVVGMGNSAMDIATDLSHVAARTLLSVRRGSWVIPKRLLGQARRPGHPAVGRGARAVAAAPAARRRCCCSSRSARPSATGCPRRSAACSRPPDDHRHGASPHRARARSRRSRRSSALAGDGVRFADGTREEVDAIVWCTGYRVTIPFLDQALVGPDPKELPLYKRILHLERPTTCSSSG